MIRARRIDGGLLIAIKDCECIDCDSLKDENEKLREVIDEGAGCCLCEFDRWGIEIHRCQVHTEIEGLCGALAPLVAVADIFDLYEGPPCNNPRADDGYTVVIKQHGPTVAKITVGDCRKARAALKPAAAARGDRPPKPQLPPNRIIREDSAKPEGET